MRVHAVIHANERSANISAKIFIGNLSFNVTKEELQQMVAEFGSVTDVFLPTDRMTGKPRGFAFVEFSEASAAERAIEKLNGMEHQGRALRVNEAEPRERRPSPFRSPPPPDSFEAAMRKNKGSRRGLRGRKRSL